MSRVYSVVGENITIANAAVTLVIVNPPSARTIQVLRAWASNNAATASAQIGIDLGFKASVFGTYVSATPQALTTGDPVSKIIGGTAGAAGTAGINASAEGAGTFTTKYPDSFNILGNGFIWTPSLNGGEDLVLSGADALAIALKLQAAPAQLAGWNFGITFKEIG